MPQVMEKGSRHTEGSCTDEKKIYSRGAAGASRILPVVQPFDAHTILGAGRFL